MADLDETDMIKLASELVKNIRPYKQVFADFGIDENDYYELEKNPFFVRVKEHFTLEWNSIASTADRNKVKSMAGFEHLLPIAIRKAQAEDTPLAATAGLMGTLAKVAGIAQENKNPGTGADRFIITINLGADTEVYNKSIEINPNDVDPATLVEAPNGKTKRGRPKKTAQLELRPTGEG